MISRSMFLRVIIGVTGLLFVLLTFWLGKYFNLSIATEMVVTLFFAMATFFGEFLIAIDNLDKSVKKVFPILKLPAQDQAGLVDTIRIYNKLKEGKNTIPTKIALAEFDSIHHMMLQAERGGDFIFHDIYKSSMILIESLEPGHSFKVISNLTKPFYWRSGKVMSEHAAINIKQAQRGIKIERIFVFDKKEDFEVMKEIMEEQQNSGIQVLYTTKEKLFGVLGYASFAISEELNAGIISHRDDLLGKVTVTSNPEIINTLSETFDEVRRLSEHFTLDGRLAISGDS